MLNEANGLSEAGRQALIDRRCYIATAARDAVAERDDLLGQLREAERSLKDRVAKLAEIDEDCRRFGIVVEEGA